MEKKQLNFNAPLISVRRMSSIVAQPEEVIRKTIGKAPPNRQQSLPVPKSKRDASEVTQPAAVPFVWEQTPGQRKAGNERKTYAYEEPSTTPKLPPGRMRDTIRFYSGERPRSQNIYKSQTEALPWNDHAALLDSLVESMHSKGESDVESGDGAYSDAFDMLSPTESLSFNCSISGLSGYQGPDVRPSGTFSVDLQTRDFMMSRFLPAAKAVVLETPQYVPKKELVVTVQPKPVKKIAPAEKKPMPMQKYEPHIVSHYSNYTEDIASETEDEMDENVTDKQHKRFGRSWKLFPRLCVKNSLCLLNPLPGMKTRTQAPTPTPPTKEVKRLTRNAYSGPLSMARKAYSGPLDKLACEAMYNKRFHSGALSGELYKVADNRREPNRLSCSRDLYKSDGLSPHRHSRSGAISPYRNVAPRSPFNEGARFLGVPREVEKSSDYLQDTPKRSIGKIASDSQGVDEKTVYVDSVNNVEIPSSNLASSKPKSVTDSDVNLKNLIKGRRIDENLAAKSSTQHVRGQNVPDVGRKFNTESLELADKKLASTPGVSKLRGLTEKMDALKLNLDSNQQFGSSELSIVHTNITTDSEDNLKPDDDSNCDVTSSQSSLPPPLPKSPSESWLWRTLPSIPLQNPKKQRSKATKTAIKWETIVKSSNLHHDHTRYSEELVPHGSRQQKRV